MEEREIWRDIENYKGIYQISNLGNLKNVKTGKNFKISQNKFGYVEFCLRKNGKAKTIKCHRLVAEAFIPNPNKLPQVNHKDENKLNNRMDNLEWCDNKYNSNYGTRGKRIGEKLSKVLKIPIIQCKNGVKIKVWNSAKEVEETLGIKRSNICKCLKKIRNTAGGYNWEYENLNRL